MDPLPGGFVIFLAILAAYALPEYLAGRVLTGSLEQRATLGGSVRTGIVQLIIILIVTAPFITAGIALFLVCVTVIGRGLDIVLFGQAPGDTKILEKYTLKQVLMVGMLYRHDRERACCGCRRSGCPGIDFDSVEQLTLR